jgi:hypothetical protein
MASVSDISPARSGLGSAIHASPAIPIVRPGIQATISTLKEKTDKRMLDPTTAQQIKGSDI